jgi:hypothetical protein
MPAAASRARWRRERWPRCKLLGKPDGFLANPQVHIPLPKALQDISKFLGAIGMRKQLEELELSMNRAAEAAVPMARTCWSTP